MKIQLFKLVLAIPLLIFLSCENEDDTETSGALSSSKAITTFTINNVNATIDEENKILTVTLDQSDFSALAPVITISGEATISPASGVTQDFSGGAVVYTVTAEDGTTQTYSVTVSQTPSSEKVLSTLSISGINATIDQDGKTASVTLSSIDFSSLSPIITVSDGATINPASGVAQDFSTGSITYTVTAEDGTTQTYEVSIVSNNIEYFTYNDTQYEIVKQAKTWEAAATYATSRGGALVRINDADEQTAVYNAISSASITLANTTANDGGGASYLWLGGNDSDSEGTWVWDGDNDGTGDQFWQGTASGSVVNDLYNNWGNEPDNYLNNQDGLAIALNGWPLGAGFLGSAGQWNDIAITNTIYFIIEF